MDGFGQVLGAELALFALGEPLQDLEVAHPEPVPLAQLALERGARRRMAGRHLPRGLLLLGGRAADLLGRRRVFLVALAVFALVSVFGGLVGQLSSAPAALAAYRPALGLITGVAAIGMLVALSGLRGRPVRQAGLAGDLRTGDLAGAPASGNLADGDLVGCPALRQAADVTDGGTRA